MLVTFSRSSSFLVSLLLLVGFSPLDGMEFPDLIEDVAKVAPLAKNRPHGLVIADDRDVDLSYLPELVSASTRIEPQGRLRLSILLSELLGRPDDAYIQLKSEAEPGEADWYGLQELYLADLLGMEGEVRLKGNGLSRRWFSPDFKVGKIALCESVQAFGQYEPLDVSKLRARQLMILYVECHGLSQSVQKEKFLSRCEASFDVIGGDGKAVYRYRAPQPFLDKTRSRRLESYLWMKWKPDLAVGRYELVVRVKDLGSGISSESRQKIEFK